MNKVIITGRLTADPEVKQTTNGIAFCEFQVAVDRGYNSKSRERVTDFITVQSWRNTADFVGKFFHKGKSILVVGQMIDDKYTDKEGQKHDVWKVRADEVEFYGNEPKQAEETEKNDGADADAADMPF